MDAECFKSRYLGLHPKLYRVAFALTGSAADAEDVLQEVYARLWKKRDKLGGVLHAEAFAVTATRNACLDWLRSPAGRKNRPESDRLPEPSAEDPPDGRIEARDRLAKVHGLIERLPDVQRRILRLSALDDLPPDEVAALTGLSPGNVRTILSQVRKTLREQMKKEYDDD